MYFYRTDEKLFSWHPPKRNKREVEVANAPLIKHNEIKDIQGQSAGNDHET